MASLLDFSVSSNQGASFTVSAKVQGADPLTGGQKVTHDFTGKNAIHFPSVLSALSQEEFDRLRDFIAVRLVEIRAGLS